MNFNSWQCLVFLPVVVGLYWLLPHKFRWVMLLICSYFFYMSWNAWLIILIMTTTVTAYVASNLMKKTQSRKVRKALLIATLIICLGILIFFKYINFLLETVVGVIRLFNAEQDSIMLNVILPVGISFYTFQTLSYVVDVYRGDFEPEPHFVISPSMWCTFHSSRQARSSALARFCPSCTRSINSKPSTLPRVYGGSSQAFSARWSWRISAASLWIKFLQTSLRPIHLRSLRRRSSSHPDLQ